MTQKPLELDTINALLKPQQRTSTQVGPCRWYDKEMRCASKGCSSPTYICVEGIPRCTTHALQQLNQLLVERGGDTMSEVPADNDQEVEAPQEPSGMTPGTEEEVSDEEPAVTNDIDDASAERLAAENGGED